MHALIMFFLLIVKHALLANLVDLGYSESRSHHCPYWKSALVLQLALEGVVTFPIAAWGGWPWWGLLLVLELGIQAVTCLLERKAPMDQLLRWHVRCELMLLFLYAVYAGAFL